MTINVLRRRDEPKVADLVYACVHFLATYTKPPERQEPSRLKYLMKRFFPNVYWPMVRGKFETLFDLYLGKPYTTRGGGR
jgi:hypothetical protein